MTHVTSEYNLRPKPAVPIPELPAPSQAPAERPGPRHSDGAAAIRRAIGTEPQSRSLSSPDLEHAVRVFATRARAIGTPPERMLAALVAIIADNMPLDASDWWRAVLRDRIVVWAIEGYYDMEIEP